MNTPSPSSSPSPSPSPSTSTFATRLRDFFVNYFSFSGQLVSQKEAEESIREGVSFKGVNMVILILAILIASLGLNTNSTAVIIGAMLISPLMGPIIGCGLGIGVHDFDLIKRSLRNLLMAAGFSVIASAIYFLISPVNEQHSELLARTSPTIYDVLIGFVGGGAGILAIASRNKGNVIPGVAIATALMPPLCTAGYGLATWQVSYFFGASYLFIINSIYIAFSTYIGVKLMKYRPVAAADPERSHKVMKWVYTIAILTMVPAVFLTISMFRSNRLNVDVDHFVAEECQFPNTQVIGRTLTTVDGTRVLRLTLIGRVLPVDSLALALEPRLKFFNLSGTRLEFVQGDAVTGPDASTGIRDIYQIAQTTITSQQEEIDSLRSLLRLERADQSAGQEIAPEVKVLFPSITDIAISNTVFAATHPADSLAARPDSLSLALITLSHNLTTQEHQRLAEYLRARLALKEVRIITIPSSTLKP